mmetsp:Transcript_2352/g.8813  ORF Transcript_2352/g.8813 Transcript_2352/m.8813 type:complete len:139 (+) Transcript_2352:9490-9906(+)
MRKEKHTSAMDCVVWREDGVGSGDGDEPSSGATIIFESKVSLWLTIVRSFVQKELPSHSQTVQPTQSHHPFSLHHAFHTFAFSFTSAATFITLPVCHHHYFYYHCYYYYYYSFTTTVTTTHHHHHHHNHVSVEKTIVS